MKTGQNKNGLSVIRKGVKKNILGLALFTPFVLLLYLFVIRPQVIGIIYSLFDMVGFEPIKFVGFENYKNILSNPDFPPILFNTIKYVLWSLVIGFPLPVIMAIMVNEMRSSQGFFRFSLYLPAIVPTIAASMIWFFMYYPDRAGLFNAVLSKFGIAPLSWLQDSRLVIPLIVVSGTWKSAGATMIMYVAALTGVNQELYEAAVIDGAGLMKRICHITLPQISPIIILGLVQQIISVFQTLEQPMTMTGGGPNNASMPIAYWAYKEGFEGFRVANSLAISTITFLILIVMTVFYFSVNKKLEENI